MRQYLEMCQKAMNGQIKKNRTGIDTIGYFGDAKKWDLSKGFPVVTTKSFAFKSCVAEYLSFLRGYDNASQFRALGCKVWDENANNNSQWLKNYYRRGKDDLGRIYGVQARNWEHYDNDVGLTYIIDQLDIVYQKLRKGIDDRRLIVTHWNPGELDQMALPPCHLIYQFNLWGDILNLKIDQRSCDLPLGVPFNITGYAWLLSVMAHITGLKVGELMWTGTDIHIYENQIHLMKDQLTRKPHVLPKLEINPDIKTLKDLDTWVMPSDFSLVGYEHDEKIDYPFAC